MEKEKTEIINEKDYEVEGYTYCDTESQHCLSDCWFIMYNAATSIND